MTHHRHDEPSDPDARLAARLDRYLDTVTSLGGAEEHRRDELVEAAEDRGLDRPSAEQAYDLARDAELPPAYGIALVLEGISVRPMDGPRPDVDASEPNEPEWVDTPPDPKLAHRERRIRQTFRRFRSRLEEDGPEGAVRGFREQPDVEAYDFDDR